jgi:hypothetical protein
LRFKKKASELAICKGKESGRRPGGLDGRYEDNLIWSGARMKSVFSCRLVMVRDFFLSISLDAVL